MLASNPTVHSMFLSVLWGCTEYVSDSAMAFPGSSTKVQTWNHRSDSALARPNPFRNPEDTQVRWWWRETERSDFAPSPSLLLSFSPAPLTVLLILPFIVIVWVSNTFSKQFCFLIGVRSHFYFLFLPLAPGLPRGASTHVRVPRTSGNDTIKIQYSTTFALKTSQHTFYGRFLSFEDKSKDG